MCSVFIFSCNSQLEAEGAGHTSQCTHRVLHSHEAVAYPAPGGAISADVRERPVKVPVWRAERNLLYCLINYKILEGKESIPAPHTHTQEKKKDMRICGETIAPIISNGNCRMHLYYKEVMLIWLQFSIKSICSSETIPSVKQKGRLPPSTSHPWQKPDKVASSEFRDMHNS